MIKAFLNVAIAFSIFWLVAMTAILGGSLWAAYFADPALMSEGSISQTSPASDKLLHLGTCAGLLLFGLVFVGVLIHVRRRILTRTGL